MIITVKLDETLFSCKKVLSYGRQSMSTVCRNFVIIIPPPFFGIFYLCRYTGRAGSTFSLALIGTQKRHGFTFLFLFYTFGFLL